MSGGEQFGALPGVNVKLTKIGFDGIQFVEKVLKCMYTFFFKVSDSMLSKNIRNGFIS